MRIWLASASPRRRQLLEWAGFTVDVRPAHIDETRDPSHDPVVHARVLATRKAAGGPGDRPVLAADTVVHLDDRIFEKPVDRAEAIATLRVLSGRWHQVTTGVCVRGGGRDQVLHATTRVRFRELVAPEIEAYVATGAASDKAGAYGIQGQAGAFVARIDGSWTNVMGLPLEASIDALTRCGATRWIATTDRE